MLGEKNSEEKREFDPASILLIVKPGFTDADLVHEISNFLSKRNVTLNLVDGEYLLPYAFLEDLYEEHKGKHFYEDHMNYMKSGPCRIGTVTVTHHPGLEPTSVMDELVRSKTTPSIRLLYARSVRENVVHCSDSPESRVRELKLARSYRLI